METGAKIGIPVTLGTIGVPLILSKVVPKIGPTRITPATVGAITVRGLEVGGVPMTANAEGYDPLTGTVTWTNNKLSPNSIFVGYGFGKAKGEKFTFVGFTREGKTYFWGSFKYVGIPSKGSSTTTDVVSYALNPSNKMTLDAFVFVASGTLNDYVGRDWDKGTRVIGFNAGQFKNLDFAATRVFTDVLTVAPYKKPASVESFSVAVA